jgi:ATP-dependent helicase/nuclease subunit B
MTDAAQSPIGITNPVTIPLGGREVKLRGKIDRIDQDLATGNWQVWDYKTGSLWDYTKVWRLQRGRKLQHVIYTRALTQMLRAHGLEGEVDCSGYYFPTAKGGGERITRECAPGELEHALNLLFDTVGSGWFPLPDAGKCDFCEFREICGDQNEAALQMSRKEQANAGDPAVAAWRKLQEVE